MPTFAANMQPIIFVTIVASLVYCTDALHCPNWGRCDPENDCSPVDPATCYNNELVTTFCGCCDECAKGPGEECGGVYTPAGTCATGLFCKYDQEDEVDPGKCSTI